jgi:hypothetical protein
MPPPDANAQRPSASRPRGEQDTGDGHSPGRTHRTPLGYTTSPVRGDLARFVAGRERVLGRRVTIPTSDPVAAAQAVSESLGPRGEAYVRQMLAELAGAWSVDAEVVVAR